MFYIIQTYILNEKALQDKSYKQVKMEFGWKTMKFPFQTWFWINRRILNIEIPFSYIKLFNWENISYVAYPPGVHFWSLTEDKYIHCRWMTSFVYLRNLATSDIPVSGLIGWVWRRESYGMGRHICSFPYRAACAYRNSDRPTLHQWSATAGCSAFCSITPRSAAGWQRKTSSGEDSTAVPAAEQCGSSQLACSIPWLVANRACLGHSRPACTTESSTTKNAPSFGRSHAGGVEEDTPATDCQTHQEYASSLCGLHRCNRWTYAILTDLWGFIGDPSDLPYKFSHSHLALQTPTDGFLSVNEMM